MYVIALDQKDSMPSEQTEPAEHLLEWRTISLVITIAAALDLITLAHADNKTYFSASSWLKQPFLHLFSYANALWEKKPHVTERSEMTLGVGECGEYLLNPEKVLHFLPKKLSGVSWKSQLLCHVKVAGSPW